MAITMPMTFPRTYHSNKEKKNQRIAKQVQILLDVFGGTLVEGGKNE